jgi:hypothetical protein
MESKPRSVMLTATKKMVRPDGYVTCSAFHAEIIANYLDALMGSSKHLAARGRRSSSGGAIMQEKKVGATAVGAKTIAVVIMLCTTWHATAQSAKEPYPTMAPVDQYLMEDRASEIALARSAAPESISRDAEVLVLGRHGYETAGPGKNGFVCIVERGWTAPIEDANFWNPKLRAPICFNPAAARSYLPRTVKKTDLILAGRTKAQMVETITAAIDKKELPAMEPGAMSYMLSKDGNLGDGNGHWHPHLMFFFSQADPAAWGANLAGSPVIASNDTWEHLTTFLVPVRAWSDGTADR